MRIGSCFVLTVLCCAVLPGCAAQTRNAFPADQRKPDRQFESFVTPVDFQDNQPSSLAAQPTGALTLQQALATGLMRSPELAAFSWEVRAAEARELQAGLLPNPEISAEVENFGGNNELRGFQGADSTVQISQLFELGGKRAHRRRAAELEKNLAGWEYEIKRLEVFEKILASFWDVMAAQERAVIAQSLLKIAQKTSSSFAQQVASGKAPHVEQAQAKIALTKAELQYTKAKSDLHSSRSSLAEAIGTSSPAFEKAEGRFDSTQALPGLDKLYAALEQSPAVVRWKTELEKRKAEVKLKDAGVLPDITISAGPRYFNENNDKALVMGLSVPIPLFNRNQGERREARFNVAKAEEEQRAGYIKLRSDLSRTYESCLSALYLAEALRDKSIPEAQKAFETVREGYRQGKFTHTMLLDAQRTLFELKQQHVDTLADYHTGRAALERLAGQSLQ